MYIVFAAFSSGLIWLFELVRLNSLEFHAQEKTIWTELVAGSMKTDSHRRMKCRKRMNDCEKQHTTHWFVVLVSHPCSAYVSTQSVCVHEVCDTVGAISSYRSHCALYVCSMSAISFTLWLTTAFTYNPNRVIRPLSNRWPTKNTVSHIIQSDKHVVNQILILFVVADDSYETSKNYICMRALRCVCIAQRIV